MPIKCYRDVDNGRGCISFSSYSGIIEYFCDGCQYYKESLEKSADNMTKEKSKP